MKTLIHTILIAIIALPIYGQEKTAGRIAELKVGDRFELNRIKESHQLGGEERKLLTRSDSKIGIVVEQKLDHGGLRLRWTLIENAVKASTDESVREILDELTRRTQGNAIVFDIDATAKPLAVVNKKEILQSYGKLSREMDAWMQERNTSDALRQGVLRSLNPLTVESTVEERSLRDIRHMFFRPETMPRRDAPVSKAGRMPNPFGQQPATSKIETRLEKRDDGVWLLHSETLDADKAMLEFRQALEQQALERGQPLPENFRMPRIEVENRWQILGARRHPAEVVIHESERLRDGAGRLDREVFRCKKVESTATGKESK